VTGAARRVGRAIALALGRRGARLAVHYGRSRDAAESTVEELRELGGEAVALQADLTDPGSIAPLFARVEDELGGLDVLVNSAASFVSTPFDEIDAEEWDRVHAVNLRAPFLCTQAGARLMRATVRPEGAPGAIVNITDLSALGVWRGFAHHSVSKAGLLHLTRVAAWELAPAVRVNAIAPGAILPPPGVPLDGEEWRGRGASVPTGRTGSPEQIGDTVVFLAENDFLNGTVVPVDGGEHLIQGGRE
jgi:NAD(P)-dependent dehydrogenase (short-subunit alcohol dehydrogenase family)